MKALIALLLIPSVAAAEAYSVPNQNGGEIVITDRPCVVNNKTIENLMEAYSWGKGPMMKACWRVVDGDIHMIFLDDGDRMVYPIRAFKKKEFK